MNKAPPPHLIPILVPMRNRNFAAALKEAESAMTHHPNDPELIAIAALCALRAGDPLKALPLLQRQIEITPGDMAARFNLASALTELGRHDEALQVAADYGEHANLARLAGFLFQQAGRHDAAITAYRAALDARPEDWESWNNLGNSLVASGQLETAVSAFENAANRGPSPGSPEIFRNLLQALNATDDRDKRLYVAQEAHERFPYDQDLLLELGLSQSGCGLVAEAEQTLRRAADAEPTFGAARLELGLLYENANRLDDLDALIAESGALGESPELVFLQAWSARRRERLAEAAELAARIPDTINPIRTGQLRAELADRLGDPAEAFRQYGIMNAAVADAFPAPAGPSYRETIDAKTAAMTALPPLTWSPSDDFPDPIFIVGSPRSGTTLLDTLLGALPELQIFEERPMLAQIAHEFADLTDADPARLDAARRRYYALAEAQEGAANGRRIVDKHPLHLTHMPLIARLFPNAAIVFVERHPAAAVLSCFMANFTPNFAMRSYLTLDESARTYASVMENWTKASSLLPLRIHHIRYERMIEDLESEMRPLIAFLDLPWSDSVLDNQDAAEKRGPVRTASYAQIGQPLFSHAIERWRNYRPQLDPVLPILQPWIDLMGYSSS